MQIFKGKRKKIKYFITEVCIQLTSTLRQKQLTKHLIVILTKFFLNY